MPRVTDLASLRVGVQSLRINPLRTFLSTLGVVIGVASLVAVLSLGDGMEAFARREIDRTTMVQNVFVGPVTSDTADGVAMPRERFHLFTTPDVRAAAASIQGQAGVVAAAHGTTWFTDGAGRRRATRVTATSAAAERFHAMELAAGRFFTPAEDRANGAVVVVSDGLARALAPGGAARAVGMLIRMADGPRRVVGVLAPREQREGMGVFVPLAAAEALLTPEQAREPRTLMVKAARVEDVAVVRSRVEAWLATRYGAGWKRDFVTGTDAARAAQMRQGVIIFKLFMASLTAISLLVGGIGIMNVLLASVTERTREIGVRKAVGARRRDIVLQFLSESVAVTGAGSLAGAIIGLAGAAAATAFMRARTEAPIHAAVSWSTLVAAAGAALLVGTAFGLYPALRAGRLSPIDAIRHE